MRISDSERARIAEKLRERADDPWMELGDLCGDIGCDVRRGEEAAVFRRLADLIDPDRIPDNADENAHGLSGRCDREALLDLADRMEGYARYCKERSIQVGSNLVECYARRIREAVDACEARPDAPVAVDYEQTDTDAYMDDSEAADGARTPSIEVLQWVKDNGGIEAVKKRLMPEGMQWPTVDGKPVDFVTGYEPSLGVLEAVSIYSNGACEVMGHDGIIKDVKEIHVAKPKVLDADGVEVHKGDEVWSTAGEFDGNRTVSSVHIDPGEPPYAMFEERQEPWSCLCCLLTHERPVLDAEGNRIEPAMDVWWVCEGDERGIHAEKLHVESIGEDGFVTCNPFNYGTWVELEPSELYVYKPVLAADGKPLREGETVWSTDSGTRYTVEKVTDELIPIKCCSEMGSTVSLHPSQLTHERPVADTWERLEKDAEAIWTKPIGYGKSAESTITCRAVDLVRRAKALAGDA